MTSTFSFSIIQSVNLSAYINFFLLKSSASAKSVGRLGLEYLVTTSPKSIPANVISLAPNATAKNMALSPSVNPPKL